MFTSPDAENIDKFHSERESKTLCGSAEDPLQNGQRCDSAVCSEVVGELDADFDLHVAVVPHAGRGGRYAAPALVIVRPTIFPSVMMALATECFQLPDDPL